MFQLFKRKASKQPSLTWLYDKLPLAHHSTFHVLNRGDKLIQARRLLYVKSISSPVYSDESKYAGTVSVLYLSRDNHFYIIEYKFDSKPKSIEALDIFSLSMKEGMQYVSRADINALLHPPKKEQHRG